VEDSFTPKQVASALQVSESSVKRWCDRGVIRTDRTLGGHRRIPLENLMEFLESTNRRVLDPKAIGLALNSKLPSTEGVAIAPTNLAEQAALRERFERAVVSGNEPDARRVISQWYASTGSVVSIADDLLAPTFTSIGHLWQCGELEIYQERRGCEICMRLVHELRRLLPEPTGAAPLAMGGTAAGDQYQMPTQLIDLIFRENGWRSENLGCDLPFSSMLSAARKHMPKIFWLSISHVRDESQFIVDCDHFAKQLPKGILLVIGGHALHEGLRRKLTYSSHCDNMNQLATLARTIRSSSPSASTQI
jgi:excisionase family DNA binding protein